MNNWRETKLGNFAMINMGQSPKSEYYNDKEDGLPFLQGNRTFGIKYPTYDTYCSQPLKFANEGEVLFSVRAPVGDINIANRKICIGRGLASLNAKNGKNDFLYFLLHFLKSNIVNNESGSVFGAVNKNTLENIDILLPPLPEQTVIASILSSLDDKIDLLHRQNTTLEKMAETLFRQWFVEEAKEEWKIGKLSELVNTANTGLDAIRRAPIVENYTGIKCLRIQDISQNKPISSWGNTKVSESDFVKAQLKKGDILMARTCSPGILLHIQENLPAVFNNGLARIRANMDNCHPLFLKYLFKTDLFINHIYGISDGTAVQLNMKLGDLLSFELNIPPKEIINTFIDITSKWNAKIKSNQSQIHTLTSLRDTLLPKLMSGEVRVEY